MAQGDKTMYSIVAPPEATIADVHRMTVETYLNEENPPDSVVAEPLGVDPQGNGIWAIIVTEGPEKPQEASGGDSNLHPGDDTIFGNGGP